MQNKAIMRYQFPPPRLTKIKHLVRLLREWGKHRPSQTLLQRQNWLDCSRRWCSTLYHTYISAQGRASPPGHHWRFRSDNPCGGWPVPCLIAFLASTYQVPGAPPGLWQPGMCPGIARCLLGAKLPSQNRQFHFQ